ncbi:uncharacterized protein B0H18DRAFT_1014815 [Fomitopsis serialis]|uniref:uncharacterized protein n=1 Tax=Fomitopsis serialis TaxID=139415 RepID=UPI002008AE6D|nr:uncharacterized protein B0H18DRAFT_1014815 [Neoantrodia serialis]KAH9923498.1 hypothetical protein B0H18DRAFT_1014815 [Neoantrodia serialis]
MILLLHHLPFPEVRTSRPPPADALLLLERQRLQSLVNPNANALHIPQIARNMRQLRAGLEEPAGNSGSDADAEPFTPYTDDPEAGYTNDEMLQMQRQMMNDQDVHLDRLSQSVNRQRDLSLQINDELDVHTGLLEELDHELDHTGSRLSGARKNLERVAKGARENGSTVMIAILILVLLILIIIFKT